MKSQQILNILFGLLVVCIQLHSLSANQEADNAVDADKERLREYLKAMSEYNSDHAMTVDPKKAYENNEEESSELNTEDNNDAENDLDKRSAYLRFGKRSYLRFGRNPNLGFLRFGKRSPSSYLRFGKRSPAYLRFGRSVE